MEEKNDKSSFKKDNYKINISLKGNNISLIIIDSLTNEEYKRIISEEYFLNKNSFFSYFSIIGLKDFLIKAIKDPSKYNITKDNKNYCWPFSITLFMKIIVGIFFKCSIIY